MKNFLLCVVAATYATPGILAMDGQTRAAANEADLQRWLENMYWHHRYSSEEIQQVTGLTAAKLRDKLEQFGISEATRPKRPGDRLFVLPYPGGRHPRIGFLDGAIEPQRETKISVFCPWDDHSYAVMDVPEAIWSNLGLTYLAHTHIDTVWTKQGIDLPQLEWDILPDGKLRMQRTLPNGIEFGTQVRARQDHLQMKMWLKNGTEEALSDLRVQNCVMLKGAAGFDQQTNDNKLFIDGYGVASSPDKSRWIITAWDPVQRAWANAPCPCLHSDPKFPDCEPGETKWLRGWFSFYEGTDIKAEIARIEATGWRQHPLHNVTGNVVGRVVEAGSGKTLPCRLYVQNMESEEWLHATSTAVAGSAIPYRKQIRGTGSVEIHTTLSADPFQLNLKPGRYRLRAVRGKEYIPAEQIVDIEDGQARTDITLSLKRFVSMADAGWYSGDTHVHRKVEEMPNLVAAEDLNVALPLTHWVRDSTEIPSASGPTYRARPSYIDNTHVYYPVNTEYEIFSVNKQRHTQGAVFVLNHRKPLNIPAPPARPVAEEARRQGAILDLDKHSWNWSMMIVPIMNVDLFELSNNHHWQTKFGFPQWTLENSPDWPEVEKNDRGFTESGWTEFGLQTYYCLLNCGYRMRVTAGTASGVHPVATGHGRVYVHCADRFDYHSWIENLNRGHSFVTQGPLLDLRFNGALPGSKWIKQETENTVRVSGTIQSLNLLQSIQIIRNGEIATSIKPQQQRTADGVYVTRLDHAVSMTGTGWVALRCFEDLPDNKISFAHTNPVFVDVPDHPLLPRKDRVSFLVQRMDEEIKRNTGVLSEEAVDEFREAREIYGNLLQKAR